MNSQYQHAYCQVSGTPFEQGVQQGQELSDAIRRNLASVHRKLEQEKVDLQAYQAFVNKTSVSSRSSGLRCTRSSRASPKAAVCPLTTSCC